MYSRPLGESGQDCPLFTQIGGKVKDRSRPTILIVRIGPSRPHFVGASPQSGTGNVSPSFSEDLCAMTPMAM